MKKVNKKIEKLVLKYLESSDNFWVDLFPLIEKSEYSYFDFFNILSELIKEKKIKIKDGNNISFLKLTKRGKLINENELFFKIDKKEIKTKWFNEPWIGYLIAFITLLFAFYQGFQNHSLEKDISSLKLSIDSLRNEALSHKKKLDSLSVRYVLFESKLSDLKNNTEKKK
ncbi:hypothetical protein PG913_08135 [Tenacibaculum pacificus]|uniref:hypothetical protein n=1 Tax=Tenacibaculum pacificus TaxID=3018314 RepID=UPI0022F399D0|nr:hypothetical protein [Tenacibaculum pacificus]WBX72872.1 hypothetical protein PG913_08135 [Tenacibaculum pacificus]